MHSVTGADLSLYKSATLHRRIARRMVLNKAPDLGAYVTYLRHHKEEVEALYQDVLINVTSFFRNPEVFEMLKKTVFPQLIKNTQRGSTGAHLGGGLFDRPGTLFAGDDFSGGCLPSERSSSFAGFRDGP